MKKLFLLASVAVLALGSCTSEFDAPDAPLAQGKYKIIANYPLNDNSPESRTTIEDLEYSWSAGDGIGVFVAGQSDNTNALFSYTGTGNVFAGDLEMLNGENYYAYYPYDPQADLSTGKLTAYINEYQNFNHNKKNTPAFNHKQANGSFAPGAAPSVASGTAVGEGEDVQFETTFLPVASYLVVPVTGVGTLNTVTLTVTNGEQNTKQTLAGTLEIDMEQFLAANTGETKSTDGITITNPKESIILSCGKGLDLTLNDTINLWFVVPGDLTLQGSTINLEFDGSFGSGSDSRVLGDDFALEEMGRNAVRWFWKNPADFTPFVYGGDGYLITDQYQFLEYANLVTKGEAAITAYATLSENNNKTPVYTNLPNMITYEGTWPGINNVKVKDAIIATTITFDQQAAVEALGTPGTGIYADDAAGYYSDVYGTFTDGGYIIPIGGGYPFNLSGLVSGETTTGLQDLTVKGSALFNNTTQATIADLTLDNLTVNAEGLEAANLLVNTNANNLAWSIFFNGVTVEDSQIENLAEGEAALFTTVSTAPNPYTWEKMFDVTNQPEGMLFANNMLVQSNFSFVDANVGIDDLGEITIYQNEGYVLTVSDEAMAVKLIDKVTNNDLGYSVVDTETSYWTGTTYADDNTAPFTAEELAAAVQGSASKTCIMDLDLNLMGSYGAYWWASGGNNVITLQGADFEISNVYINGTDGETQKTSYLTLLGRTSVANTTINDITIENEGENAIAGAYIGAVSGFPNANSNVTVNGMTVKADKANANSVGGLYASISNSSYPRVQGEMNDLDVTGGVLYGSIAGQLTYEVSAVESDLDNPLADSDDDPFGTVTITVQPAGTSGSSTLNVTGFSEEFIKGLKPVPGTGTTNDGYYFVVVADGVTYQWKYNSTSNEYVYQGTVVNN